MRFPSAIRTFDPAFFHQSPGRLDGAPMLGRGLPTNYPFGALHGALGIPPGLMELATLATIPDSYGWSRDVTGNRQPGFSLSLIRTLPHS